MNKVVNLWVERRKREIEKDEKRLVWVCNCGSKAFYWYDKCGLVCYECETPQRLR